MAKIDNDKYYTPIDLATYCINKTYKIIGQDNISEIIEPSAGNGSFSNQLNCIAYDLIPEGENIIKQDYLTLGLPYKQGRLIIGNPPYGTRNTLSVKFFKKSIQIADYIAFILPISQLNNNQQMYDFDLVHSEDLGLKNYTNRELHCCFNIYKRPKGDKLNKKPNYKLNDITLVEYRRGGNESPRDNYDYAIGTFGAGCVGKEINKCGTYALECYFYINNNKLKDIILNLIKTTDWKSMSKGISNTYRLPQWKIYKYIKEQIPEIS